MSSKMEAFIIFDYGYKYQSSFNLTNDKQKSLYAEKLYNIPVLYLKVAVPAADVLYAMSVTVRWVCFPDS